jgi:hypothetical protein
MVTNTGGEGRGSMVLFPMCCCIHATPITCWYSVQKYQNALTWLLLPSEFSSYVIFLSAEHIIAEFEPTLVQQLSVTPIGI